jgi:hypothetical protein
MFGWFKEQISSRCRVRRSPRQPGDPITGWLRLFIGTGVSGMVRALVPLPASGQTAAENCSGYPVCPVIDYQDVIANDPDIGRMNAGITRIEAATLAQILAGLGLAGPRAPKSSPVALYGVTVWIPSR